eukprot:g56086.t1
MLAKNLKNVPLKAPKVIITREGEEVTCVGPGCRLSKQFLAGNTNDITDVKKTVVISRKVEDPITNQTFRQMQLIGQNVIDPVRTAAVGYMPDDEWVAEIEPDLQLMVPAEPPTPVEELPVVYDFVWLKDQPAGGRAPERQANPRKEGAACTCEA